VRIEAYIRVVSDERSVRQIQQEAGTSEISISTTKARIGTSNAVWWNWSTPRVRLDSDSPDRDLKMMLERYRPLFQIVARHRGTNSDVWVELITHYEEHEAPQGVSLSSETIALMAELGAGFDNDVYRGIL
jgi:hypothetical protein